MYQLLKPLIFRVEPEPAHDLVSAALGVAGNTPFVREALARTYAFDDAILHTTCAGLSFRNPVGLAAGFDKQAALIDPLARLGFGHVEVGTVTPRPQPGNPRPRMFRLPEDTALINRLGFNSPGMRDVAARLRVARAADIPTIIGVNIGKNRDTPLEQATEDYAAAFVTLAPLADYVTVNISSPNTPGLRKLHDRQALEELLGTLAQHNAASAHPRPIFLKVSPDETPEALDEVIGAGVSSGVAGFIATNTTLSRDGLHGAARGETGGLSGTPLTLRSRAVIGQMYRTTGGKIPIIGVGGIMRPEDAYEHMRAGASLVQVYSGLVYHGPGLVRDIARYLAHRLRAEGYQRVAEIVGSAAGSY